MFADQASKTDSDLVLEKLVETVNDKAEAERWMANHAIPSFGNMTALQLIQSGHTAALLEHIEAMFTGAYA